MRRFHILLIRLRHNWGCENPLTPFCLTSNLASHVSPLLGESHPGFSCSDQPGDSDSAGGHPGRTTGVAVNQIFIGGWYERLHYRVTVSFQCG